MAAPRIFRATTWRHAPSSQHHFAVLGSGTTVILASGVSYFRSRGTNDGSYFGDKLWETKHETPTAETVGNYVASEWIAQHFQACFGTPPANFLEVAAYYANDPTTRRGSTLASHCWVGLGTDGLFRLFNSWTTGSPPTGNLIATADTAIPGFYANPWAVGSEQRVDDVPSLMRDYVILIRAHATLGEWHMWEQGVKIASFTGLNTLGASGISDLIHTVSLGQRPPQPDLGVGGAFLPGSNPFPGNAEFQARYQNYVIADDAIGRCRVHTLFPTATGFYDQWGAPQDPFGVFGSPTKADVVRDDPFEQGGPDQDVTYLPADGLFQTFTHAGLPALGSDEFIQAVGVNTYVAAAFEATLPFGAVAPMLMLDPTGAEWYQGEFRPLFDAYTPLWPLGVPNGGTGTTGGTDQDDFTGEVGFRHFQDFWTDVPLLNVDAVDALEFGCNSGTAPEAWLSQTTLLVVTAIPLCEGPPSNPYPPDPPPPPEPVPTGLWVRRRGQWRQALFATDGVQVRRGGASRVATAAAVRARGAWRIAGDVEDTDPPPDTDLPPHYDPCELLPPAELPPTEPLGPPPARLFFAWDHPITQLGPLFTAAPNALGQHTPGNVAQAIARSATIIGAQGGYSKFLDPNYNEALMFAWIASHLPYLPGLIGGPGLYGTSGMDDHASPPRWPPSGLSVLQLSRIFERWKTLYPTMRIGFRARAAQFSGSNYPANVDFIIPQYRYWGGLGTPEQFRDTELNLCTARGWKILWSINIENGGLGASGITHRVMFEMTPAEVLNAWMTFIDLPISEQTIVHGLGLWKFSTAVFGRSGMLDVFAICRNALQALGAP